MLLNPFDQSGLLQFLFCQTGQSFSINETIGVSGPGRLHRRAGDPSCFPLLIDTPIVSPCLHLPVINDTADLMGKNFRIPIVSIIGVFAPSPKFSQDKPITAPLQKICHITLGENGARPSYGFVGDFIPAAWIAASFVVAGVFDRNFSPAAGTVTGLGPFFL